MQFSGHLNEEVTNRFKIIFPKQLVNHVEILTSNTVEVINAYAPYLCVTIMDRAESTPGYNFVEIFRRDFF